MRWMKKAEPQDGKVRIQRRFLWLPRCIGGEWRWLESAKWRQVSVVTGISMMGEPEHGLREEWRDECWLEVT